MKNLGILILAISLTACAGASVTPMSRNTALISTRAAPVCGTGGAVSVASKMAAIATIKQGYERFVVVGADAQNNTRLITTGPTYATTNSAYRGFGNTVYGTSQTSFGGQQTFVAGGNDAQMQVVMLNRGDVGFDQGIDAKQALGPDWEKLVKGDVNTCF